VKGGLDQQWWNRPCSTMATLCGARAAGIKETIQKRRNNSNNIRGGEAEGRNISDNGVRNGGEGGLPRRALEVIDVPRDGR